MVTETLQNFVGPLPFQPIKLSDLKPGDVVVTPLRPGLYCVYAPDSSPFGRFTQFSYSEGFVDIARISDELLESAQYVRAEHHPYRLLQRGNELLVFLRYSADGSLVVQTYSDDPQILHLSSETELQPAPLVPQDWGGVGKMLRPKPEYMKYLGEGEHTLYRTYVGTAWIETYASSLRFPWFWFDVVE